jgi:energy-coupling factor transporter ATP-binding protein EcfA2
MRVVGARIHNYRGGDDLVIPIGAATVLIGPNGSGKTSLLRSLGFVDDPSLGSGDKAAPTGTVSYYLGAEKKGNEFSVQLREALNSSTLGDPARARTAVGSLTAYLCICRHPDGRQTIAVDVFRLLIDESENKRLITQQRVIAELAKVSGNAWVTVLLEALAVDVERLPLFVDLDLPAPAPTPALSTASFVSLPDEISPVLTSRIEEILRTVFADLILDRPELRAAVDAVGNGHLQPALDAGLLDPVRRALKTETNLLAPSFLRRHGEITLGINSGPQTPIAQADGLLLEILLATDAPEITALAEQARSLLRPYGDTIDLHLETEVALTTTSENEPAQAWDYRELGTGMRRWICGVVDEACRNIVDRWRAAPLTAREFDLMAGEGDLPPRPVPEAPIRLRLIDEPVENLEGRAQTEVLGWLRSLLIDGSESLVVATHDPSLLKVSGDDELVVIAVNWEDGRVKTHPMGPALLTEFERLFAELEISREELLFLARFLLMVEGPDDINVITAIFGDQLEEKGVMLHSVAGSDRRSIVTAFSQSAYRLLRIPTWALLDSTPDATLGDERRCAYPKAVDNHKVLALASADLGQTLQVVPFEPHDIAAGIHPHTYRLAFPRSQVPHELKDFEAAIARCTSGKQIKELISHWIFGDTLPANFNFSQDVMTKVCTVITERRLGVGAATPWLRSAMNCFLAQVEGVNAPKEPERSKTLT